MPNSEGWRLTTPLKYDVISDWQWSYIYVKHDAVDPSELVYEELLRQL